VLGGWAERYQSALAQPARRRLALLVGINRYSEQVVGTVAGQRVALSGALTDVELQRQLLIQRFGFAPADVVTLTDAAATRQGILDAVRYHLVDQAQAQDLVVLHFSGYGSRVKTAQSADVFNAWVPVDGDLPSPQRPQINDLLEHDLLALLQHLATQRLTTIIDAGTTRLGKERWGTLRPRSRPLVATGEIVTAIPSDPTLLRWPGLMLRGGANGYLVLERDWPGFSAGVFTYALTQLLWEANPPLSTQVLVRRATAQLQQWTGPNQKPVVSGGDGRVLPRALAYFINPGVGGAGGITALASHDSTATLWLGGVPTSVVGQLQPGSLFRPVIGDGSVSAEPGPLLRLSQRQGLSAVAKVSNAMNRLAVGQLVREEARVLGQDLSLVVALDSQLERVERVDATSALAAIPFVTSVTTEEDLADCLFGRLPQEATPLPIASPGAPAVSAGVVMGASAIGQGYGLFAPNRTLLPGSLQVKDEAVKTAVGRLVPYLASLLALKLVRLTENRVASQVGMAAEFLLNQPESKALLEQRTQPWPSAVSLEGEPNAVAEPGAEGDTPLSLAADSRVCYRVVNQSSRPLHINLIRFDSRGQCWAWVPGIPQAGTASPAEGDGPMTYILEPDETYLLPLTAADWGVPRSARWVETYIVASPQPFRQSLKLLRAQGIDSPRQAGLEPVADPLALARALLTDLTAAAAMVVPSLKAHNQYGLHHSTWASLRFRYAIA